MNCKQGELAIIVRSYAGNEGKIVRCVRLIGNELWRTPGGCTLSEPTWEVDRPLVGFEGGFGYDVADSQLRPIRDQDGDDEILRLVGKPETEQA